MLFRSLDDPDKASQELEKDSYIRQRVAEAIAEYKKEAAAASLQEKASQMVYTANIDDLGPK